MTTYKKTKFNFDIIFNTENLGFGKAINHAVKSFNSGFLLLVNPDVILNKNTIKLLIEHANENSKQGVWGVITLNESLKQDYRHAWREPTLLRTFCWSFYLSKFISNNTTLDNYKNVKLINATPYPVDSVSGCCMLISHQAWTKTSGFDEIFFLYSEELDFCKRARVAGFQPTVVPKATLQHAISHTADNRQRLETLFNSKFLYAQKHHHLIYVFMFRLIIASGALVRGLLFFITRRQKNSLSWFAIACNALKKTTVIKQNNYSAVI